MYVCVCICMHTGGARPRSAAAGGRAKEGVGSESVPDTVITVAGLVPTRPAWVG
jgi:hypothetical protein